MFPRLSAQETFVADAKFAFREAKMSLNLFRNTLLSQQMILRSRAEETIGKQCFCNSAFSFAGAFRLKRTLHVEC